MAMVADYFNGNKKVKKTPLTNPEKCRIIWIIETTKLRKAVYQMCKTLSIQMTIHNPRDTRLVISSDISDKASREFIRCSSVLAAFSHAMYFLASLKWKFMRGLEK